MINSSDKIINTIKEDIFFSDIEIKNISLYNEIGNSISFEILEHNLELLDSVNITFSFNKKKFLLHNLPKSNKKLILADYIESLCSRIINRDSNTDMFISDSPYPAIFFDIINGYPYPIAGISTRDKRDKVEIVIKFYVNYWLQRKYDREQYDLYECLDYFIESGIILISKVIEEFSKDNFNM